MEEIERYLTDNIHVEPEYFSKLLKTNQTEYVYLMYAYYNIRLQNYSFAMELLSMVPQNTVQQSLLLMVKGLIEIYHNNDQSFISLLHKSAEADKKNKWVRLELFYALQESKPYLAFGYLEEALKIDENFNEAVYERVKNYDPISNCGNIISEIMRMPQSYVDAEILNTLAYAFYNRFEVDNALKIVKGSLDKKETPDAYHLLGTIYVDNEELDSALLYFDKALGLDLDKKDTLVSKGWVLFDLGRIDEAKQIFFSLLKSDRSQELYNQVVQFCFKIRDFERALLLINESQVKNGINFMNEAYLIIYHFLRRSSDVATLIEKYKSNYSHTEYQWLQNVVNEYSY
jgi:tetratricopeptide (TPR) repeat protein